jgi:hypothetical protein
VVTPATSPTASFPRHVGLVKSVGAHGTWTVAITKNEQSGAGVENSSSTSFGP